MLRITEWHMVRYYEHPQASSLLNTSIVRTYSSITRTCTLLCSTPQPGLLEFEYLNFKSRAPRRSCCMMNVHTFQTRNPATLEWKAPTCLATAPYDGVCAMADASQARDAPPSPSIDEGNKLATRDDLQQHYTYHTPEPGRLVAGNWWVKLLLCSEGSLGLEQYRKMGKGERTKYRALKSGLCP